MCGRYSLTSPKALIASLLEADTSLEFSPQYNIAPRREVPVCRISSSKQREIVLMRWGLIPAWFTKNKIDDGIINARAETIRFKPSFRGPFLNRRCLIPADGYYEWQLLDKGKQPYHIRMKDVSPFSFAGIWDFWGDRSGRTAVESCAIITIDANELLKPIHARMPLIISQEHYATWLNHDSYALDSLQSLLSPYSPENMEAYSVSRIVNNPENNIPRCSLRVSNPDIY